MEFSRTCSKPFENLPNFLEIPKRRNVSISFSKESPELFGIEGKKILTEENSSEDSGTPKFSQPMRFENLLQVTTQNTSEDEGIDEYSFQEKDFIQSGVNDFSYDTIETTNPSISCQCFVI